MGKVKEIWCMSHSHLDVGYTHPQPMLLELQGDYIEQAIELCEKTRDYPQEAQFKWTCEATYPVTRWMEHASEQWVKRFVGLVAEKRISITALPMHTTPGCTDMQMLDMVREMNSLRELLQNPVNTAVNHDVNGQPWTMSRLLLDSGVDFYLTGINIHFGGIPFQRPCAFWWEAPDGRRLLSFLGEHYSLFSQFCRTCEADTGLMHQGIRDYVQRLEKQGYPWDFAFLTATNPPMYDNNCPDAGLPDLIRRYNEEGHPYKVRFATPEMLRDKLLSMGEDAFPVYGGDWTDYWNFGSASTARETKVNRQAARALESADVLECMTGIGDGRYQAALREAKENALLYEEHTWGASQSVSEPDDYETVSQLVHKKEMAYRAADLAGYAVGTQMERLAGNPFQSDGLEGVLAVNPTGVTDEVALAVPTGWMKKERQLATIRQKGYIPYLDGARERKELLGRVSIPPFSARAFTFEELRRMRDEREGLAWLCREGERIETPFYRIALEKDGGIRQIYAKREERNLLDETGERRFFELVRETIDGQEQEKSRSTIFPRDVELGNQNISVWNHGWKAERKGSFPHTTWSWDSDGDSIRCSGRFSMEGIKSAKAEITFYRDLERIDLSMEMDKEAVGEPEGIYLVFPLALREGWKCVYDTAGQFVELDGQQLGDCCRDYVTVENGLALYDDHMCVAIACPHAPMVQIGGFNFGQENRCIRRRENPIVAAWPMNNYWDTNFAPWQDGRVEFRYQLTVGREPDPKRLYRDFVRAEDRGLTGAIADFGKLGAMGFGEADRAKKLISCSEEGMVTNLYPAKAGGMMAVLKNHGAAECDLEIAVPGRADFRAYETDPQERVKRQIPVKDGKAHLTLSPYEWKLLRLIWQEEHPSWGNAFRINNQSIRRYPLTLVIHDREHWKLVGTMERRFGGRYPLGYIGSSPWVGTVTNQETMDFTDMQNRELYDLLCAQMEIGWVVYALGEERKGEMRAIAEYMKERFPEVRQMDADRLGDPDIWLEGLVEEIEKSKPPLWFDSLDREEAEWTNLSVTLPKEEGENRILLVGDSISAGYGDMVQRLLPHWHVDRLNTSEGIHHPNFLRVLEIALKQYPYRTVHINNGIHLHGQTLEQYRQNLFGVFAWIHRIAPKADIIYATNTTFSRRAVEMASGDAMDFQERQFGKGGKAPLAEDGAQDFWVTDEAATEPYEKLNEAAREICKEHGICVNDLYRVCVDENLQKTDSVHFTEEAYRRLALEVADALKRKMA